MAPLAPSQGSITLMGSSHRDSKVARMDVPPMIVERSLAVLLWMKSPESSGHCLAAVILGIMVTLVDSFLAAL